LRLEVDACHAAQMGEAQVMFEQDLLQQRPQRLHATPAATAEPDPQRRLVHQARARWHGSALVEPKVQVCV
jgi:hypothetical protein